MRTYKCVRRELKTKESYVTKAIVNKKTWITVYLLTICKQPTSIHHHKALIERQQILTRVHTFCRLASTHKLSTTAEPIT